MELQWESDDLAMLIDADGQVAARLARGGMAADAFAALAARIAGLGAQPPRLVVCYREGLREEAAADIGCELILIEDDRFDDPPLQIRRVRPDGDPAGVDRLLDRAAANGAVER